MSIRLTRIILTTILVIALTFPTAFANDNMVYASNGLAKSTKVQSLQVLELPVMATGSYGVRDTVGGGTILNPTVLRNDGIGNVMRGYRELDDYRNAGVWAMAKVPFDISEVRLSTDTAKLYTDTNDPNYAPIFHQFNKMISDSVYKAIREEKAVHLIGGSCAPGVGIAGGIRRAYGKDAKIANIYMDAHGDVNTRYTSFSGSIGGMPYAVMMGLDMDDWREYVGLEPALEGKYSIHAGARDLDRYEPDNFAKIGCDVLTIADARDANNWKTKVNAIADQVDTIYLHIDADYLDPKYIQNVNTPYRNGATIWELMDQCKAVMDTDKVSVAYLASIYFDNDPPDGDGTWETSNQASQVSILSGIRTVTSILSSWDTMVVPKSNENFNLKYAKVTAKNQPYTGKAIKPALKVTLGGKTLVKDKDYKVSFKNNIKTGKATAIIESMGDKFGKTTATFKIVPKRPAKPSIAKAGDKNQLVVKWKKDSNATGYQVKIGTNSKVSKGTKVINISKKATTKATFKKVSKDKAYYAKVRAYKTIDGKKVYGAWSAVKKSS